MQDMPSPPMQAADRPGSRTAMLFLALLTFLLGGVLMLWVVRDGYLDSLLTGREPAQNAATPVLPSTVTAPVNRPSDQELAILSSVEGRVSLLEERLSRVDFHANAASGNAARAEGLLIAFAARRMVDRGEPLSYIADQLRLRFTNAQPRAVQTIIDFSSQPVTLDELSARLEALSPELAEAQSDQSFWARASAHISSLFTVHRDSSALLSPTARIDRARVMLIARRIPNAIAEVERLPNAGAASNWIADARRYQDAQDALNLLETTAMLEPRRLQDGEGRAIEQSSPLATPAATPDPQPTGDAAG